MTASRTSVTRCWLPGASWGRDYIYLLAGLEHYQELDAFVDIDPDNLLHNLQHDILELRSSAVTGQTAEEFRSSVGKRPLDPADRSLTVHVCHSPQREVEVLHDRLLAMFDEDPTLTPRDVIVMVADIDSYSPFIQAVFGSAAGDRYVPWAISDRRARQAHPALEAFITLLSLPDSRFVSEDVLALLDVPVLAARFSIDEEGLRYLRQWVNESGIRWGLDDDNVREWDLPATGQHTWRFGLTRMLLGLRDGEQPGRMARRPALRRLQRPDCRSGGASCFAPEPAAPLAAGACRGASAGGVAAGMPRDARRLLPAGCRYRSGAGAG
ncbi:Exodeoxyribonuclease V gamma chain [Pluralibacter gergoviae]|nr:Exodeoxyribonuclease V gamma chain [Pluralibacter gergoviae]